MIVTKLLFSGTTNSDFSNNTVYTVLGWCYNSGATAILVNMSGDLISVTVEGNSDWSIANLGMVEEKQVLRAIGF